MNAERMRVLELVDAGKITVDDGVALLKTLNSDRYDSGRVSRKVDIETVKKLFCQLVDMGVITEKQSAEVLAGIKEKYGDAF